MAWDENLPAGNQPWNLGDDAIRANNAALADAVEREHEPLTDATYGGIHKQGSARAHVWTGATLDQTALNSNFNNPSNAKNSGKIVLDQPEGRIWICRDGASGLWVELSEISGALAVNGALTATGLLSANNGVTIPTTKLLTGPTGENWLVNGAQQMNPLLHAARHLFGGEDALTGIVAGNVVYKSATGPTSAPGTLVTHTYDFSARAGNSLLLALYWAGGKWEFVGPPNQQASIATLALQLNDVDKGQLMVLIGQYTSANAIMTDGSMLAAAFTVPNSAGQKVDLELKTHVIQGAGNLGTLNNYGMVLIDLGTLGLTT
jgi:hypothetical protein